MTVVNAITIVIASAALLLSAWNFWFTQMRRGRVLLSQPTIFFFGWDKAEDDTPKIMFRSALFSTGSRGNIVESIYLIVNNGLGRFVFPFWGYDDGNGMVRGSGLFVGVSGHIANHHFNPLEDADGFSYVLGHYSIEIWLKIYNAKADAMVGRYTLSIDGEDAAVDLAHHEGGIMWNWTPTQRRYHASAMRRRFDVALGTKDLRVE